MRLVRPVYRAHHPRWSFQPEAGDGAARFGGRFNPVGTPALYTSLRLETAWLEAQQGFPFKAQPMTLCAYEVDCDNMLDLTDAAILASLDLSPEDLAGPWEILAAKGIRPPTWLLAERLWRWSDIEPHRVRVIDHLVRLPRDDRSWRLEP